MCCVDQLDLCDVAIRMKSIGLVPTSVAKIPENAYYTTHNLEFIIKKN